eukprot:gene7302-7672_t
MGEEFGQTVVLTKRIRSVLRGYPEGTSVIKELIQNADDIILSITQQMISSTRIWGAFKAQLYSAITMLLLQKRISAGDSRKQDDSRKVGRFGVGFNSVYHLTDVPCFVSGDDFVIFDPHSRYISCAGKRIK